MWSFRATFSIGIILERSIPFSALWRRILYYNLDQKYKAMIENRT